MDASALQGISDLQVWEGRECKLLVQTLLHAFEGKKTASACSSGMVPSAGPNIPGFDQPTVQRTAPMDQHRVCRGLHPWRGIPVQTKQQKILEKKNSKFKASDRHNGTMEKYAHAHKHKHEYGHMRLACIREDILTYPSTCVQSTLAQAHIRTHRPNGHMLCSMWV